jgi:hypothetical protein
MRADSKRCFRPRLKEFFRHRPRQDLIDAAVGMRVYDFGDDVGEIGVRTLQVSISDTMTASPPPSEPANNAFLRSAQSCF